MLVRMALMLRRDFSVHGASNAEEAVTILLSGGFHADAIVLDYRIGNADGIDLLRHFRTIPSLEHTPILFLTGRLMAQETAAMIAAGAAGILPKPFNPLTLAGEVRRLMGH